MLAKRFNDKVAIIPLHPCHEWTGSIGHNGYGRIRVSRPDGKWFMEGAHRVSWALANGRWPMDGEVVMHSCDNRSCVNPDHLFLGTQRENLQDARRKGRNIHAEYHPFAKLTDKDVAEIRKMSAVGMEQRDIGRLFGVSQSTISKIVLGYRRVRLTPDFRRRGG